ncbi:MAG: hypothetical protein EXX96DRAFT_580695 [Benjaminiella poitrasii]|nr:MAG: hypothetical protein EXX96DRAFT_580695 [Benjaminiella poitrasii]
MSITPSKRPRPTKSTNNQRRQAKSTATKDDDNQRRRQPKTTTTKDNNKQRQCQAKTTTSNNNKQQQQATTTSNDYDYHKPSQPTKSATNKVKSQAKPNQAVQVLTSVNKIKYKKKMKKTTYMDIYMNVCVYIHKKRKRKKKKKTRHLVCSRPRLTPRPIRSYYTAP